MRRERWAAAALCLAAAALIRETYVLAFIAGLVWSKDRRTWWPALGALAVLGALHGWAAASVLSAHGKETPFGTSGLGYRYILSAVSPGNKPLAWALGLVGGVLGLIGLASRWATDRGARMVATFAAVMYPATIFMGRVYWGLAFGVAVAVFAPSGYTSTISRSFFFRSPISSRRRAAYSKRNSPAASCISSSNVRMSRSS
jgi:hypothetical protein